MNEFPYEEAAMPYNPEDSAADDAALSSPILLVKQNHERSLLAIDGVEGVGIGRSRIGDDVILVYLRDETVKQRIPFDIEGFQVQAQITGIIDVQ